MITSASVSSGSRDTSMKDLVDELIRQIQQGDPIDVEELAGHDAERAEQLRQLLPTLARLNDLGLSINSDPIPERLLPDPGASELRTLGDFRIVREVGRGGMGIVYEAVQLSLNRRVALKVLPFAAVTDEKHLRRFRVEAQAAAMLHHNSIVPVHAVGCERGVHYYAMQFIEGEPLSRVISELRQLDAPDAPRGVAAGLGSGPFSAAVMATDADPPEQSPPPGSHAPAGRGPAVPSSATRTTVPASSGSTRTRAFFRTVAQLGIQAAEALEHAHGQGVLHRDIKPSNLLIDARGHLWVTDFGLARLQSEVGLTMSGDLVGTLLYMSPEQALANRTAIDHRTDIYSLGATLYELLTLQSVFDEEDRQELLRRIAFDDTRPLRQLNPAVPRELETIVLKALEKDPAMRFATAQDLADDLRHYLEDRPIKARRPSLAERAVKWSRRHPAAVPTALVVLMLAVLGLSASTVLILREKWRADAAAVAVRRQDYILRVNLALTAVQAGDVVRAEDLLRGCPEDLCRWEWHHVLRLCHLEQLTFREHSPDQSVNAVVIRDDGLAASASSVPWSVAGASDPAEVLFWDVATGRLQGALRGLTGSIHCLAFSPDGKRLAVAGASYSGSDIGSRLSIWEVATGRRIWEAATEPAVEIRGVAFLPDGDSVVAGYIPNVHDGSGYAKVWDLKTRRERRAPPGLDGVHAVAVRRDGRLIALAGYHRVVLWDLKAGALLPPLRGPFNNVYAVAFSPDGSRLAAAGWDWVVRIWNLAGDTPSQGLPATPTVLPGHQSRVWGIAFSPDGKRLATASADRSVLLWDVRTGRILAKFHGHTNILQTVAFHPEGYRIVSGGLDGTARVWDTRAIQPVVTHGGRGGWISGIAFRRDGLAVLTESRAEDIERIGGESDNTTEETRTWDSSTGTELRLPPGVRESDGGYGPVHRAGDRERYDAQGKRVAILDGNQIKVIDVASGRILTTLRGHTEPVTCVAFNPDGDRIATSSSDRTVKLWDAATGAEVLTLPQQAAVVTCVAFNPAGDRLASGGGNMQVLIWDARPMTASGRP